MANQKHSKELREQIYGMLDTLEFAGHEWLGRTSEGVAFQAGEDVVVVRAIVKSETFDVAEAIEDFAKKEAKRNKKKEEA